MKKAIRRLALVTVYAALVFVPLGCTYFVTKMIYVPSPIRIFRHREKSFREYVELVRRGAPQAELRAHHLAQYDLTITVDGPYVFFAFANMAPLPNELIGCRLHQDYKDPAQHPSRVLAEPQYKHLKTYRFELLDSDWFYWEFDF
jgi:hypothetical protein